MNTLVTFIVLALTATVCNAQGIIELKEAKVEASPLPYEMSRDGNSFSVNIKEKYAGEFELNPMSFLERNFDIDHFIAYTKDFDYDAYEVSFVSSKGKLVVRYNDEGEVVKSRFKFKDVTIPYALIQQTYLDNKGWSLVKNKYVGREKAGKSKEAYYLLTMQLGKDKKQIKVDATAGFRTEIANLD